MKHGINSGLKSTTAPSIHMIKADIMTEVTIVGSENRLGFD